ncbi:putative Methyltransf_11 domain-containing protein [Candidatus Hydrogenisulfobacillus filiaventi]|uniref:Putative Methyltransf_11 domain-containing protein n=1 Tax=Candidatus Hydrogenisulfobacillus filiaventi TaxID=2707344 RepID=A0A6F8ZCP2_9FIRM|nr:class I SAM-dependent methyltransferase [Bacillota bacterium]CAB1127806.1 putative Methyltransf_11 domain-containing protein [Candidatus Hydrogenisulfobacillus filiaventi]
MRPEEPAAPYGDDFGPEAVARWFQEEAAYHDRFQGGRVDRYPAPYAVFDDAYLFRGRFRPRPGEAVLDFGCAEGLALARWRRRQPFRYVGVDASPALLEAARARVPDGDFRLMPDSGRIPAADGEFTAVVVLGVLHHVPTVSRYLAELGRVLAPGGRLFLREPVHAMGRRPGSGQARPGLSPNERGIPLPFLVRTLTTLGLEVETARYAFAAPAVLAMRLLHTPARAPWELVRLADGLFTRALGTRVPYERPRLADKLYPTVGYLVARKP